MRPLAGLLQQLDAVGQQGLSPDLCAVRLGALRSQDEVVGHLLRVQVGVEAAGNCFLRARTRSALRGSEGVSSGAISIEPYRTPVAAFANCLLLSRLDEFEETLNGEHKVQ